ncbi:hypothetical protein JY96_11125 [Aquabacterium sp. NJ1]|uniref:hypothetical protein n=1 Tax=Aquabacterium sp. NJ1 TaxID=1538295 RepID=UPI00052BB894|nr:hypothetical protein [Aquabacterium sp. NJ1]KGM40395.1 hypothetical protein JY96_11125 [Aquabacterium sp. NJ1]
MTEGSAHAALEQDAWLGGTGPVSSDIAMPGAFSFGLTNDGATTLTASSAGAPQGPGLKGCRRREIRLRFVPRLLHEASRLIFKGMNQ